MKTFNEELISNHQELTIESKSVVLVEHLDKIANLCLSDNFGIKPQENFVSIQRKHEDKQQTNTIKCIVQESLALAVKNRHIVNVSEQGFITELFITSRSTKIAKKYFQIWRTKVRKKCRPDTATIKKEKIDKFVERLKECKQKVQEIEKKDVCCKNQGLHAYKPVPKKENSELYKNRYKAQKNLIENQKAKLAEQQKIIENLRLGIIQEETEKSIDNSKYQIREIFRKCSGRVRCKITPPIAVENDVNIIELRTSKPPKLVIEMEKRAEERAIKRQIILERKKILDERKQKNLIETLEKKKVADEEQRQKNLDAIKEKRRQEADAIKVKELQKQKYLETIRKANKFYNRKIKLKAFRAMMKLIEIRDDNELKSECFYDTLLRKHHLDTWRIYTITKISQRNFIACNLYDYNVLKKMFTQWKNLLKTRRQSVQVADDLFDMKLQGRVFILWRVIVCQEQINRLKKLEVAERHYDRRILVQYFYQWRSLPAVNQLEKAKEEKKRKWRERVWEIIPDYKPYSEDSMIIV